VLLGAVKPLTQEKIAMKLGGEAPDKVTIYRTLETFVDSGLVHKAYLRKRSWHFELARNCTENQCHPHFTCTECGVTHCLTDVSIPLASTATKGFTITRQRVQLEGLCPKCNTVK
jgi:Fur family ferric uptake transcriptional regulator